MHLTAAEIAQRGGGTVVAGPADALATSWAFDSRELVPGACFVALRGERDGHDFVATAFGSGAVVALVARPPADADVPSGAAVVVVDDPLTALGAIAHSVRRAHGHLHVVGVAGSTGKTSTKDLLQAALVAGRRVHANPASFNNEVGLPLTILNMASEHEVLVLEMGERLPGDVAALCEVALPTVGVITNVGLAHAEHLGGPAGVARALAELLEALPPDGLAVLNAEDEWTRWLASRSPAPVVTVGFGPDADVRLEHVELADDLRVSFRVAGEPHRFELPLRGAHHAANAAMAFAVARHLGIGGEEVAAALRTARGSRWRMELDASPIGVGVLNDAYNANPASMDAALRALCALDVPGQRIAVLGDMRELGEHSDAAHASVGRLAGSLGLDAVVGVGEGGARIAATAGAVPTVITVRDAGEAAAVVCGLARPGDAVLVKASRALGLERVASALMAADAAGAGGGPADEGDGR